MEDIFNLSRSNVERDFVNRVLSLEFDVVAEISDYLLGIPFVSPIIKLGVISNKYLEHRCIKKIAKFLSTDVDISQEKKDRFINGLTNRERRRIADYILQYLLRAEDDDKAEIMGYIYADCVLGMIDKEMMLRLCSIIDRVFLFDLYHLPEYAYAETEESTVANNFINLGLIDNYVGGFWRNDSTVKLNGVGMVLFQILDRYNWFARVDFYEKENQGIR